MTIKKIISFLKRNTGPKHLGMTDKEFNEFILKAAAYSGTYAYEIKIEGKGILKLIRHELFKQ